MRTRNSIPFPPGFPFYATMNDTITPVYPPGLHIDPEIVRRLRTPRFIANFPLMSNKDHKNMPRSPPKITFNSIMHDRLQSFPFQYYPSNFGTVIRAPHGSMPSSGASMIRPPQNSKFEVPFTSKNLQQRWSTQAQDSELPICQAHGLFLSYELLGECTNIPEGCSTFATGRSADPASNTFLEENQQRQADCAQSSSTPDQQAYPSSENHRGGDAKWLGQAQVPVNGGGWSLITECYFEDKPAQLDNWGLPNTDLKYFNEGMPYNPHMLDLEYVEESPPCVLLFSPEEALTYGTWTDWKLNNRIRRWMIEQDLGGIANSVEDAWTYSSSKNFVASSALEHDYISLEDTVQVWESVSSTEEGAGFNQQLHEKTKLGLEVQVLECLEGEEDWIPGGSTPEMARVMEEGW